MALPDARAKRLRARLEALYQATDAVARLAADPVSYAHRYHDPRDVEIAALIASQMAYGRVSLFRPVLDEVFAAADAAGGPRAWVERFDPDRDGATLEPLYYRWTRGRDLVVLVATLQAVLARHGGLEPLFGGATAHEALGNGIAELRAAAVHVAPACRVPATRFEHLPRGTRYFFPSPAGGSACKRWNMLLRWMIRPATEGIDLGLWRCLPPAALVVPLDTHVLRIGRFVGLTTRRDGSWRTAEDVTASLRRMDPDDPVRYDFALAHLGISGRCRGTRDDAVCPHCPLVPECVVAQS